MQSLVRGWARETKAKKVVLLAAWAVSTAGLVGVGAFGTFTSASQGALHPHVSPAPSSPLLPTDDTSPLVVEPVPYNPARPSSTAPGSSATTGNTSSTSPVAPTPPATPPTTSPTPPTTAPPPPASLVISFPPDGPGNRLSVAASNIAPGDTVERAVDLRNTGNVAATSITLSSAAIISSLLDTDPVFGLQMAIERCSVPWTEGGSAPAYTYTCGGTISPVLLWRPWIGSNLSLANLSSLTPGLTDHLRIMLSMPGSAGNSFQGRSSTVACTFTALG
jgi:spore coat-associated protein N